MSSNLLPRNEWLNCYVSLMEPIGTHGFHILCYNSYQYYEPHTYTHSVWTCNEIGDLHYRSLCSTKLHWKKYYSFVAFGIVTLLMIFSSSVLDPDLICNVETEAEIEAE